MRRHAVLTLTVSAIFLLIVGAFLNTQPLFYMSTVMILTLIALRLQASLATRGLRFERIAPLVMIAGELISIRIRVWSRLRFRRPLLLITDVLPTSLAGSADIKPLPIAPSFEEAVESRYEFRPVKRGIYRWSKIRVKSSDSLGLVHVERLYEADPIEVVIHPTQIPFALDLAAMSGWGANQADEGTNRGQGMEPRGVREFLPGDTLRHIHWRTTARIGTLQVKEFETGFNTNLVLAPQLTEGTEAGSGVETTLEVMCSHAAFVSEIMLNRGSTVALPNLESSDIAPAHSATIRYRQVCDALASAQSDRRVAFSSEIERIGRSLQPGSTLVLMISAAEPGLAEAVRMISAHTQVVAMLYNAIEYPGSGLARRLSPATDTDFMASLASPNVSIKIMSNPYVGTKQTS